MLPACGDREARWTEDVKLDDGRVIQIERHVVFDQTNALGGGAYNAIESKATLSFLGDLSSLPTWDVPLIALVLYQDTDTDEWVIVAKSSSCRIWDKRGRPRPPYWEFRLSSEGWREVPLSCESVGRRTNLFFRYDSDKVPAHVTVEERMRQQSDRDTGSLYRRIAPASDLYANYCGGGDEPVLVCDGSVED
jgi:hypothetical protein